MATSRIEITFNSDLIINDNVLFEKRYYDGFIDSEWGAVTETWVNQRINPNQVTIGTPTAVPGERSAINYIQALNLDYVHTYPQNGEMVQGVSRIGNKVIIKVDKFWNFRLAEPNQNPAGVAIEIFNFNSGFFVIDDIEFLEATANPACTHYKIQVTANEIIDKFSYNHGDFIESNSETISFEVLRGQELKFTIQSEGEQQNTRYYSVFQVPSILNLNNLNVQVNASPNGGTIIADITTNNLDLSYSLDETSWQTDNFFSGLPEGNYTIYVKDNLGCQISSTFHVDSFGVNLPYTYLPKANSIRYANRVNWSDCGNYKTDENTLSCEENVPNPKKYVQLFQTCDIVKTQLHSNYAENKMLVIDENGNENEIPFIQKSSFMRRKDKRDARMFDYGNNKTGIYFLSGNIYDYDSGIDTGNDYVLNGTLPEWGVEGNYIAIGTSWFIIEQVKYDENKNADVLIISNNYYGSDVLVQVSSMYNLENFEVLEAEIDFATFINQKVHVLIQLTDPNFEDVYFLSEEISIKVRHKHTSLIRYKNSTNTDVYFNTGIEFRLRLQIEHIYADDSEESEVSISDTNATIYKANINERNVYEFSPIPTEMMRKLKQALVHDVLDIDWTPYAKNDAPEVENLTPTNLYNVTAKMLKSGKNFSSNASLGSIEFNGSNEEIPGLVDFGGGFVEY